MALLRDKGFMADATSSGGEGGQLQYEMPGCVCWGFENVLIMKEALGQKSYPCRSDPQHT